jgi:transcriptional regulator with XRE-family HTH domain
LQRVMTLRMLAERAGVSYPNISRLEHGHQRATQSTIRKLANALDVEPRHLLKDAADIQTTKTATKTVESEYAAHKVNRARVFKQAQQAKGSA